MVQLVWITPNAEQIITDCARVSSPENIGKDGKKLLKYLVRNKHWSPFEMADMCVQIETSRAISAQILRHRSFSFQEFSQRYAKALDYVQYDARRQDSKNRQNSIDDLSDKVKRWFYSAQEQVWDLGYSLYNQALDMGIAKESARFLLSLNTQTCLYMKGSIRSWIHYLQVRTHPTTQLEHRIIALQIEQILKSELPVVYEMYRSIADKESLEYMLGVQ